MGKGVSSSSALCVAWLSFLFAASDRGEVPEPMEIARLAHQAEVLNFGEPGGMQDHIASALGGVVRMDFTSDPASPSADPFPIPPGRFFLGDSGSTKDTLGLLGDVKNAVLEKARLICDNPDAYLKTPLRFQSTRDVLTRLPLSALRHDAALLPHWDRFKATLINRNMTLRFIRLQNRMTGPQMVTYMNAHHRVLSRRLKTSSEVIDGHCTRLSSHYGFGAKIVGSGGGGVYLVYIPVDMPGDPGVSPNHRLLEVAVSPGVTVRAG